MITWYERMISCNGMLEDNFILFAVKKRWLSPPEVMHLFDKGALSDNLRESSE